MCIIDGTLDGLSPGKHGLAIHECGDISGGCSTVGGHFNPRNVRHGSPVDGENNRHIGDLGNVIGWFFMSRSESNHLMSTYLSLSQFR